MSIGIIELSLVFGGALLFGIYELVKTRRLIREDAEAEAPKNEQG